MNITFEDWYKEFVFVLKTKYSFSDESIKTMDIESYRSTYYICSLSPLDAAYEEVTNF